MLIERKIWYCCLQFIILIIVWPKIFYAAHLDDFWFKKKKEKFIHIQQLGLWKKCNWYHMTEINERKNIKDTLIETLWSWWFFTQEKITGKKTDFLWIFKWEMLTSFSQNNVTLHNFSVLIIIQVLAVQCKYDEDIFNFSLLKSDQLEGVF